MTKNEFFYDIYNTKEGSLYLDKGHKIGVLSDEEFSHKDNNETGFSIFSHHTKDSEAMNSVYTSQGKIGYWKTDGSRKDHEISRIDFITNVKPNGKHKTDSNIDKIKLYLEDNELIEVTKGSDIKTLTNALSDKLELEMVNVSDDEYVFKL